MSRTSLNISANTLTEYDAWIKGSKHGDVLVYYTGDLASDRTTLEKLTDETRRRLNVINALAVRASDDSRSGQVVLFQKRLGESLWQYIAMRLRKPVGRSVRQEVVATAARKVLEIA